MPSPVSIDLIQSKMVTQMSAEIGTGIEHLLYAAFVRINPS